MMLLSFQSTVFGIPLPLEMNQVPLHVSAEDSVGVLFKIGNGNSVQRTPLHQTWLAAPRYSLNDNKYSFSMLKAKTSEAENNTFYSFQMDTEKNHLQVSEQSRLVLNAPNFLKWYKAKAGKPTVEPTADLLMTEAVDGMPVTSSPSGVFAETAPKCASACHQDQECEFFVFSTKSSTSKEMNCQLLKNVSLLRRTPHKTSGGNVQTTQNMFLVNIEVKEDDIFYGAGGGPDDQSSLSFISSKVRTAKSSFESPIIHSSAGFSMYVFPYSTNDENRPGYLPVQWEVTPSSWVGETGMSRQLTWTIYAPEQTGALANIFILPAQSLNDHLHLLEAVTKETLYSNAYRKRFPPPYAFGLTVSHTGFSSPEHTLEIIKSFRDNSIPIDSILMGTEWYSPFPDTAMSIQGDATFQDFKYNEAVFPQDQASSLLGEYLEKYKIVVGGIRKPRLSNPENIKLAREKYLLLPSTRTLTFEATNRNWYQDKMVPYYKDGIEYFWNDEAEDEFFQQLFWNNLQFQSLQELSLPNRHRYFSLNSSFTIGMRRYGISASTGLFDNSWKNLERQVGYLQNWILGGSPFTSISIGANQTLKNTPELLVRWYQLGAVTPLMRIHSSAGQEPYNPVKFQYPYGDAMKKAIQLHYRLIPTFYALANLNEPIISPIVVHFPLYEPTRTSVDAFMLGKNILIAPVTKENRSVKFHLPTSSNNVEYWYQFDTPGVPLVGGQEIVLNDVPLDTIPMYVRAGTFVILGNHLSQSTKDMADLSREVHYYGTMAKKNQVNTVIQCDGQFLGPHCEDIRMGFSVDEKRKVFRKQEFATTGKCPFPQYHTAKWFLSNGRVVLKENWTGYEFQYV